MAGNVTYAITKSYRSAQSKKNYGFSRKRFKEVTCTVSCNASGGIFPSGSWIDDTTLTAIRGMWLYEARYIAGTTGTTANSDLYLYDDDTVDLFGGEGIDKADATGTNSWIPAVGDVYAERMIFDRFRLAIAGNAVANADFIVRLYIREQD